MGQNLKVASKSNRDKKQCKFIVKTMIQIYDKRNLFSIQNRQFIQLLHFNNKSTLFFNIKYYTIKLHTVFKYITKKIPHSEEKKDKT